MGVLDTMMKSVDNKVMALCMEVTKGEVKVEELDTPLLRGTSKTMVYTESQTLGVKWDPTNNLTVLSKMQ